MKRFTYADRADAGSKFDIQLGAALFDEDRLAQRLQNSSFELKSERYQWEKTGNICIEFRWSGKSSGIAATEADYWVHELARDDETLMYLVVPVPRLKDACRKAFNDGRVRLGVGDQGLSDVILLSLSDLLVNTALATSEWT